MKNSIRLMRSPVLMGVFEHSGALWRAGLNRPVGLLCVDCVEEVGGPTVWMLQGIRRA